MTVAASLWRPVLGAWTGYKVHAQFTSTSARPFSGDGDRLYPLTGLFIDERLLFLNIQEQKVAPFWLEVISPDSTV